MSLFKKKALNGDFGFEVARPSGLDEALLIKQDRWIVFRFTTGGYLEVGSLVFLKANNAVSLVVKVKRIVARFASPDSTVLASDKVIRLAVLNLSQHLPSSVFLELSVWAGGKAHVTASPSGNDLSSTSNTPRELSTHAFDRHPPLHVFSSPSAPPLNSTGFLLSPHCRIC